MFGFYLKDLPSYGKLFVGLVTALMLGVCLWSVIIFYVDKGLIDESTEMPYLQKQEVDTDDLPKEKLPSKEEVEDAVEQLSEDSLAVLAPIWDSTLAGEPVKVDSSTMAQFFPARDSQLAGLTNERNLLNNNDDEVQNSMPPYYDHLRENVGLAHTHINGQTLLFFVLGLIFLFSSAKPKIKRIALWVFGIAVLTHAIGLTGQGFHWVFDDLLALSGVGLLVIIPYICFLIFVDLLKKGNQHAE